MKVYDDASLVCCFPRREGKSFAFYPNYTFSVRLTNKERTTFLCLQHLADLNQEVYHISSKEGFGGMNCVKSMNGHSFLWFS